MWKECIQKYNGEVWSCSMRRILFLIVLALMINVAGASATDYLNVNTTGWWRTGETFNATSDPLKCGVSNATDGEIVFVYNGDYIDYANIESNITLMGQSQNGVNITGKSWDVMDVSPGVNGAEIYNFTLNAIAGVVGISAYQTVDLIVHNITCTSCAYGINIYDCDNSSVYDCSVTGTMTTNAFGADGGSTDTKFSDNNIVIEDYETHWVEGWSKDYYIGDATDTAICDNVNPYSFIYLDSGCSDITLKNTTTGYTFKLAPSWNVITNNEPSGAEIVNFTVHYGTMPFLNVIEGFVEGSLYRFVEDSVVTEWKNANTEGLNFTGGLDTYTYTVELEVGIPTNQTDLGNNLIDHTPTITWDKGTDPDGGNVTTYIYVGTTATPTEEEGNTTAETYDLGTNIPFTDGNTYYYRLRSWDGGNWSDYTTADQFRMNSAPVLPNVSISPVTPVTTDNLTALNGTVTDAEGDIITLYYRWYINGVLNTSLNDATTIISDNTSDGETWKLIITPNDGYENGTEAFSATVTIGSGNYAPYSISGYVLDVTMTGIYGVTVSDTSSINSTATNATGYYEMCGYTNGTYTITASLDGYVTNSTVTTITGADNENVNIILEERVRNYEMVVSTYNIFLLLLAGCFYGAFPKRGEESERDTGLINVLLSFVGMILSMFLAQVIVSGQVVESHAFDSTLSGGLQHYILYIIAIIMFIVFVFDVIYYIKQRLD
jgi:hypothetical protein